jgi:glycosyltransferase 2 family protein
MKRRIINILKYMSFLGLGVFLVWWSLQQIPDDKWGEFKAAFRTARYWLILPVFLILTLSHLLRAWRWKLLMQPLGYKPKLSNTFFAVMIGYLANLAVPRLGEVLKCTILARYEKVPAEKLVGTIVAERAFDLLSLILVFIIAFIVQYDVIGDFGLFKDLVAHKGEPMSITRAIIILLIICGTGGIILFILRRFRHIRFIYLVNKMIIGIWQGIISVKDVQQKGQFLFASTGIWALYLLGTWVGFNATIGSSGLGIDVAVSALAFASIGMIVTPGGIGAYALLLAKVLELNGVPMEIGFANGTLQWFAQFLLIVAIGFISLGLLPYYNKTKHHAAVAEPTA